MKDILTKQKQYGGFVLLGITEMFEDLEDDGIVIPPYIYRHIRKFGKKHNLPPYNDLL